MKARENRSDLAVRPALTPQRLNLRHDGIRGGPRAPVGTARPIGEPGGVLSRPAHLRTACSRMPKSLRDPPHQLLELECAPH